MTLGPTSMLDPLVEGWAKEAGMDTQTLASMFGGNLLGGIINIPFDMFLTQLGSKIASGALGAVGLLLGTYSFKGQGRLQLDTMQVGSRLFTEILDPSPSQIKEIQRNVGDLIDGFVQGRWDKVAYALIRNPRELTSLIPGQEKKEAPSAEEKAQQPTQPQAGIVYKL